MQAPHSLPTRLASNSRRRKSPISLTPLIDVVFILLIFFLLASSFLDWRSLALDTRPAGMPAPSQDSAFLVQIGPEGLQLNGEPVELAELIAQVNALRPRGRPVSVQPLGDTRVQQMITVLDALNAGSIQPLHLVDDPHWQGEIARAD